MILIKYTKVLQNWFQPSISVDLTALFATLRPQLAPLREIEPYRRYRLEEKIFSRRKILK